ncbi:transcriptional regulator [Roseateles noduli]|nr:transcriptional regulator [Roseateles noduli]
MNNVFPLPSLPHPAELPAAPAQATKDNPLGVYLRDRRERLDAAALGLPMTRRRTPGLRREEVAQRAHVSPTWYTWLEQGRGGAPSEVVLERIASALLLTDVEREHLFLLAFGRAPELRAPEAAGITPRLQRVLDALTLSPAIVKTPLWDVVGWNRAATAVLTDYNALPPEQRNIVKLIFCNPRVRAAQDDWESVARFVVAAFRADSARVGDTTKVDALVREVSALSPEFERYWREHDVKAFGEGVKRLRHPIVGLIAFEYSAFSVDQRPDLGMVVYQPATREDEEQVSRLLNLQELGVT